MSFLIGLTGLIGSGKSTVAAEFMKLGVDIIDTDQIAHDITSSNGIAIDAIIKKFGSKFLNNDGSLNRNLMRLNIIRNKNAKIALENILHPLIWAQSKKLISQSNSIYVIIAVPLLFKSLHYMSLTQRNIFVNCQRNILVERVHTRDHLSLKEISILLSYQVAKNTQLSLCDDIIDNNGSYLELYNTVLKLDQKYRNFIAL